MIVAAKTDHAAPECDMIAGAHRPLMSDAQVNKDIVEEPTFPPQGFEAE